MELKNYFAQDTQGNILPRALVYVYNPGTFVPATGVVDKNGAALPSPFTADDDGLIQFLAPNGAYDLRVASGARDYTLKIQCLAVGETLELVTAEADRAEEAADNAASAATTAASAATARFLPPSATTPTTRADGSPLQLGDRYLNTAHDPDVEMLYISTGWVQNDVNLEILQLPTGATQLGAVRASGANGTVQEALNDSVFFKSALATSVQLAISDKLAQYICPEDFGAKGDNVTDDTAAFARAFEAVGRAGGGTIRCSPGRKYYCPGSTIIPPFVQLDLNGVTIRGNRNGGATNAFIKSGYFNSSDVLVANLASPPEERMLDGIRVGNGRFHEMYRVFDYRNCNRTCAITDIVFTSCVQSWNLSRSFSMQLENTFSTDNSTSTIPTYSFVGGAINSLVLNQVRAVTAWGFYFEGGCDSVVFLNCDFEGGDRGFVFNGACRAVSWQGGYFENVPGNLYDLGGVTEGSFSWSGTYNWLIDTILIEPNGVGATLTGLWDETNSILVPGYVESGHTFNQWIYLRGAGNKLKVRLQPDVVPPANSTNPSGVVFPYFVVTDGNPNADVSQVALTGAARRATKSLGLTPVRFSGDVGADTNNMVPLCTHQHFNPGATNIVVFVDTQIRFRDSMFLKYHFTITDASGPHVIAGDIYGSLVKQADSLGKLVEVSDRGNGMTRLALYGYSAPGGVYTCTGSVQLCT